MKLTFGQDLQHDNPLRHAQSVVRIPLPETMDRSLQRGQRGILRLVRLPLPAVGREQPDGGLGAPIVPLFLGQGRSIAQLAHVVVSLVGLLLVQVQDLLQRDGRVERPVHGGDVFLVWELLPNEPVGKGGRFPVLRRAK